MISAGHDDLTYFYVTVIRTALEYACPVWHSSLTLRTDEGAGVAAA